MRSLAIDSPDAVEAMDLPPSGVTSDVKGCRQRPHARRTGPPAGRAQRRVHGVVHPRDEKHVSAGLWPLAETAAEPEDRAMLVQILRNPELIAAGTAARRALKLPDTLAHGPTIKVE